MGVHSVTMDSATKEQLKKIPLLKVNAGPRDDPTKWNQRIKEEIMSLHLASPCSSTYTHPLLPSASSAHPLHLASPYSSSSAHPLLPSASSAHSLHLASPWS